MWRTPSYRPSIHALRVASRGSLWPIRPEPEERAMKLIVLAAVAAAVTVPATSSADQSDSVIVVGARPTVAQWSNSVSERLTRNLRTVMPASSPEGLVSVRFMCSENGQAQGIKVARSSGDTRLDSAGRAAVSRLRNLHPLPMNVGEHQMFEARIIAAPSRYSLDRQLAELSRDDARLAAASTGQPLVLTIGAVSAL
jgi:TonB family protein